MEIRKIISYALDKANDSLNTRFKFRNVKNELKNRHESKPTVHSTYWVGQLVDEMDSYLSSHYFDKGVPQINTFNLELLHCEDDDSFAILFISNLLEQYERLRRDYNHIYKEHGKLVKGFKMVEEKMLEKINDQRDATRESLNKFLQGNQTKKFWRHMIIEMRDDLEGKVTEIRYRWGDETELIEDVKNIVYPDRKKKR